MALIQNKDKASIVAGILVCEEHLNITNALAVAEKQVKLIFAAPATRRCSAHRNHRVVIYLAAHGFAQNRQRRPLIANLFMGGAGRSSLLGGQTSPNPASSAKTVNEAMDRMIPRFSSPAMSFNCSTAYCFSSSGLPGAAWVSIAALCLSI